MSKRIYIRKTGDGFQAHRGNTGNRPRGWGSRRDLAVRDLKEQERRFARHAREQAEAIERSKCADDGDLDLSESNDRDCDY